MRERNGEDEMRGERGGESEKKRERESELMRVKREGNERELERECEDETRGR